MPELILYTKKDCPKCVMLKRFLDKKQTDYETIDIEDRPDVVEKLIPLGMLNLPVLQTGETFCNDYNELIKKFK